MKKKESTENNLKEGSNIDIQKEINKPKNTQEENNNKNLKTINNNNKNNLNSLNNKNVDNKNK